MQGTHLLLGTPASFISSFLHDADLTFCQHVLCITQGVDILQAQFQLFCFCAQTTLPHLLSINFLLAFFVQPLDPLGQDIHFTTPLLIAQLQETTSPFPLLSCPSNCQLVWPNSPVWHIAHHPTLMGGLWLLNFSIDAASSFVVPLFWSINTSTQCVLSCSTNARIPPYFNQSSLMHGTVLLRTSTPLFCLAQSIAPHLLATLPSLKLPATSSIAQIHVYLGNASLRTLQHDLKRIYKNSIWYLASSIPFLVQ